jgi:hypothetical protein
MAVDHEGRQTGSGNFIQGSTCDYDNGGKTNNVAWMLYSVYAKISVCCAWWRLMIMAWRDIEG